MKFVTAITAVAILAGIVPAQAAQDMGLSFGSSQSSVSSRGFGAQARVTIKFGDRRTVAAPEKVTLGVAAGPVVTMRNNRLSSVRDQISPALGFTLKPGYSASMGLVGRPIATGYTRLGAAEDEKKGDEPDQSDKGKKQDTGDKIAWVAAVAGGVMVALIGAYAIASASQGPTD